MFKDKLKAIISKEGNDSKDVVKGNNKRKIENLVFLIIVLIVTVVIINYVWNGDKSSDKTITNSSGKKLATVQNSQNSKSNTQGQSQSQESAENSENSSSSGLEQRLEEILGNISGVGEVKVFISYSESSETVAMYNENSKTSVTEETDTSGGVRKVQETDSQKDIVYQENSGSKVPIVQKVVEPKIEGAIITARGASDINVKTSVIQAVEAATGLATHKIQVFEMTK